MATTSCQRCCRTLGLSLSWVPPRILRGNSLYDPDLTLGMIKARRRAIAQARALGENLGNRANRLGNLPLRGTYKLTLSFCFPATLDVDNVSIGYKHFLDGLVASEMLPDDSRMVSKTVTRLRNGRPRTTLLFAEVPGNCVCVPF